MNLDRGSPASKASVCAAKFYVSSSLKIELEKYAVGLSTTFLVLQYQSFVAQARSTEVAARNVYIKARVALDRALGRTLETYHITFDQAMRGRI